MVIFHRSRFCTMSCPPPSSGCPCTSPITAASTTVSTCWRPWPESWARLERGTSRPTERARQARQTIVTIAMSSPSSSMKRWSSAQTSLSRIRGTRHCGATGEMNKGFQLHQSTSALSGLSVSAVIWSAKSLSLALSWTLWCVYSLVLWNDGWSYSAVFSEGEPNGSVVVFLAPSLPLTSLSLVDVVRSSCSLNGVYVISLCFSHEVHHGSRSVSLTVVSLKRCECLCLCDVR